MSETLINIPRQQAYLFSAFLVFFEFLTYISNDMIMPAMLTITHDFHATSTYVASSLSAYIIGGASLQFIIGPLSDVYGRRPLMLTGACLFFCFTLLLGLSQTMTQFMVGRFFQGMGLCFLIIGYAAIQEMFEEMDAVRLIALMANAAIIAPLLGPLLGTGLILHMHWRFIYYLITLAAFFALWGLWKTTPETIGVKKRDGTITKALPLSLPVMMRQYFYLLENKRFITGAIALGLVIIPCIVWVGLSPLILIQTAHLSMTSYALWQIPLFAACIAGNLLLRTMTHHVSLIHIIWTGGIMAACGTMGMLCGVFLQDGSYLGLIPGLSLYGLGMGLSTGPLTRYLLYVTPISKGTTNALLNTITMVLLSLGTEGANRIYHFSPSNLYVAGYCTILGILYLILLLFACSRD